MIERDRTDARGDEQIALSPEMSLTDEGCRLADLQLAELAVGLFSAGVAGQHALTALRICFWSAYWEEALELPEATAREFAAGWQRCAGGAGRLTQRDLRVARLRGRRAVRAWGALPPRRVAVDAATPPPVAKAAGFGLAVPLGTRIEVDLAPNIAHRKSHRHILRLPAVPAGLRPPARPANPERN
jgi:hypothetical protein